MSSTISGTSGWSLMKRRMRRPSGTAAAVVAHLAHDVRPRIAKKAPSITTMTMMVPSMIVVTFGSTDRKVRSLRTSRRMKTATIGPSRSAPAAAERDAAEDDGGDAREQVGAGDRRADAGAAGQHQAAHRREKPGERVGDDLGPVHGDAAPERGEVVAADGVDREAEARAAKRDPDDAEADDEQRRAPSG